MTDKTPTTMKHQRPKFADALQCPYCGSAATFRPSSEHVYHGRNFGPIWQCSGGCDAYVGAHRDTGAPLGRLANKYLRGMKIAAHSAFDPLWRDLDEAYPETNGVVPKYVKNVARARAYKWLAQHMGIDTRDCHIAMFDDKQCAQALAIFEQFTPTARMIRQWAKAQKGDAR